MTCCSNGVTLEPHSVTAWSNESCILTSSSVTNDSLYRSRWISTVFVSTSDSSGLPFEIVETTCSKRTHLPLGFACTSVSPMSNRTAFNFTLFSFQCANTIYQSFIKKETPHHSGAGQRAALLPLM